MKLKVHPVPILWLLALSVSTQPPQVLGRCPVDNVVRLQSCRFFGSASPDLILEQELGKLETRPLSKAERVSLTLYRLVVLRFNGERFEVAWTSEPLPGHEAWKLLLAPVTWVCADIDRDGRDELLLLQSDSCWILNFVNDSTVWSSAVLPDARPVSAAACNLDSDSLLDVVTMDVAAAEPVSATEPASPALSDDIDRHNNPPTPRFSLRVWQPARVQFLPLSKPIPCLFSNQEDISVSHDSDMTLLFTGSVRLEDYEGLLPVVAGVYRAMRPSLYAILYPAKPDSLVFTTHPFPWAVWFSKQQVLPAGRLTLFNVGDTLAAFGYFVPGSRPAGPSCSFAALQDGEWRLLHLSNNAEQLNGLLCRYSMYGIQGWLELRDQLFRFFAGDPFVWR